MHHSSCVLPGETEKRTRAKAQQHKNVCKSRNNESKVHKSYERRCQKVFLQTQECSSLYCSSQNPCSHMPTLAFKRKQMSHIFNILRLGKWLSRATEINQPLWLRCCYTSAAAWVKLKRKTSLNVWRGEWKKETLIALIYSTRTLCWWF